MYTSPALSRPTSVMVHSFSYEGQGYHHRAMLNTSPANAAWGTANLAIYIPVVIPQTATFIKAFWVNGSTVDGNVDVGLYSESWARIASTGSTVMGTGSGTPQTVDIADFTVPPGRYYLAFTSSSATATFYSHTAPDVNRLPIFGGAQEASALPLPATATPAVASHLVIPYFGFSRRTLVG